MRFLLINPPIREWAKPNCLPLGLGYIASILLKEGCSVEVLDINGFRWGRQDVEKKIQNACFDAVGISGIITTYGYVKWLILVIKKYHPGKKIIVGGSVGSSIPKLMLEKNSADIVCIGEGEETVRELARAMKIKGCLSEIKGIWYKDASGAICQNQNRSAIKNLDDIPFPAWELFPMQTYLKNPVGAVNRNKWTDGLAASEVPLSVNIYATRGCPYSCIYCYHDFMGQAYRTRSPENVISEIELLNKTYKAEYFHFVDDEFVLKKDFVYRFCSLMKNLRKKTEQNITWGCTGRVNLMTEDLIIAMAESGCILIGYGLESGSQKMLDYIKKDIDVEQAKNAVRLTKEYLGWADCSFMIGYPGETRKTIQETVDFCKELDLTPEVIFFLTPYPGTELYSLALKEGRIKDEEKYILGLGEQGEKVRVNFTDFTYNELLSIQEMMIKELKAWNTVKH